MLTVIVGDDTDRFDRARADAFGDVVPERFDLAETDATAVLLALASPDLFGGPRHVLIDNLDAVPPATIATIVEGTGDEIVVARATKLTKSVRDTISRSGATVIDATAPKGTAARNRAAEIAAAAGVHLDRAGIDVLVERLDGDPARIRHVIDNLAQVGLTSPRPHQIELLAGTGETARPPWELGALIEAGNVTGTLRALDTADHNPFAVLAWLRNRALAAGRVADGAEPDAGRKGTDARRLAAVGTSALIEVVGALTRADIALKSTGADPTAVLTQLADEYRTARR